MKYLTYYILSGLALIAIVYQRIVIQHLHAGEEKADISYHTMLKVDSEKSAIALQYYLENDGILLKDAKVYFGNDNANNFAFFSKIKGDHLVFRFSGLFCDKCVNNLMNSLKKAFPNFKDNERIVLMSSDISPRIKETYYGKKTLSYLREDMGLPYESTSTPFFFVTGNDRIAKAIFFPDENRPDMTEKYLRLIRVRFNLNY